LAFKTKVKQTNKGVTMAKTEKEKPILKIDDKEYDIESMNDEQKSMINHIADLDRKLKSSEFNLIQLRFGRQAFVDALKTSIDKEDSEK
jgi:hypothetical protein|tara:strand:- start:435 stop:701 length:267 start_codon:yes stop_codon:yes gene_type:complete